jgi:hypothetical protein
VRKHEAKALYQPNTVVDNSESSEAHRKPTLQLGIYLACFREGICNATTVFSPSITMLRFETVGHSAMNEDHARS